MAAGGWRNPWSQAWPDRRRGGPPNVRRGSLGLAPAASAPDPGLDALCARLHAAPAAECSHVVLAAPGASLLTGIMRIRAYPVFGA